jgi:outer membrane protein OmpA-like peptidoglycan-associated protein
MKIGRIALLLLVLNPLLGLSQAVTKDFESKFTKAEQFFPDITSMGGNKLDGNSKRSLKGALGGNELDENSKFALPIYLDLRKSDSLNSNLNYRIGVCYLNSRTQKYKAIPYLQQAVLSISAKYNSASPSERHAPTMAYIFLGDAFHFNYQFNQAIEAYKTFLSDNTTKDKKLIEMVNRKIEICNTAKELVASPINVKIENLGSAINTSYADYSPIVSADEAMMIFTSRRPGSTGGKLTESDNFYEDIYMSTQNDSVWSAAENIGPPVNTDDHESAVGIAVDGQLILIYKDDNGDGNIYSTLLRGDKWTVPLKLNSNINTKYWEPSAFISADGNTLYFTSNRPGGYGGRDIYKSVKTFDGDWGEAINLGNTINTAYDEDAPFIHPDGVTLFFSSNGHKTMGGFDIFSSVSSGNNTWSEPVNVGYPINSPDDDIYYVVSPNKTHAYYSSFKEGGKGEKDNYLITFVDAPKCTPIVIYKGIVRDPYGKPVKNLEITVTDIATAEIVGKYHSNSKTGKYLFILTPGKNYSICYSADDYLFCSVNKNLIDVKDYCQINEEVELPSITIGSKITLNNIFFDFDKSTLRSESDVELNKLLNFLNKYPKMVIEIIGNTDSKGMDEYNNKLSLERAQAVVNYITNKGIKQERITAKGYGSSKPDAPNENKDGSDNPAGRQINRRVELKIIGI